MTREQFDTAVEVGYDRLVRTVGHYLDDRDVFSAADVLHNVLLTFRVKCLQAWEFRSQEEWEAAILRRVAQEIAHINAARATAGDFRAVHDVAEEIDTEDLTKSLDKMQVSDAFIDIYKHLDERARQVVLGILAGFTTRQVGEMLEISRELVSRVWRRSLVLARERMGRAASDENT